jgi:peptidoglycan hydrolase CwlO-like protein
MNTQEEIQELIAELESEKSSPDLTEEEIAEIEGEIRELKDQL